MKKITILLSITFFCLTANAQIILIGWPNLNDTVHLKDTTVWNFNDIYIVNNGVLLIENADSSVSGLISSAFSISISAAVFANTAE